MSGSVNNQAEGDGAVVGNVNIQDVIKERNAERKLKAEQRRLLDLRRIGEMKSKTGIDPLQRFPKEIWNLISNEVDPDGRGNISKIHPMFHDLTKKHRVRDILFPQVLELTKFLRIMNDDGHCDYDKLRVISKSSRDSIDRGIEKFLLDAILHYNTFDNAQLDQAPAPNDDVIELTRFKSEENPAKRFYQRQFFVNFPEEASDDEHYEDLVEEFMKKLVALFEVIGNQLWVFAFNFNAGEIFASEAYIKLQQLVRHMPNLKWLQVGIGERVQVIDLGCRSTLKRYPFPKIPSLERVSTLPLPQADYSNPKTINIFEAVLKANPHVKMLDLQGDDDRVEWLPRDLIKSLPLISLWSSDDSHPLKLEKIQHIVNFNWPLQQLSLDIGIGGANADIFSSMKPLVQFLEKFPALEILKLWIQEGFSFEGSDSDPDVYLKLPNLKALDLKVCNPKISLERNCHFFFSLQFLLQSSEKLKWLYWELESVYTCKLQRYLKKHEKKNCIDFRAGLRDLYQSNLWNVFPSLDTVIVDIPQRTCRCWCCDDYSNKKEYCRRAGPLSVDRSNPVDHFFGSHRCTAV